MAGVLRWHQDGAAGEKGIAGRLRFCKVVLWRHSQGVGSVVKSEVGQGKVRKTKGFFRTFMRHLLRPQRIGITLAMEQNRVSETALL